MLELVVPFSLVSLCEVSLAVLMVERGIDEVVVVPSFSVPWPKHPNCKVSNSTSEPHDDVFILLNTSLIVPRSYFWNIKTKLAISKIL